LPVLAEAEVALGDEGAHAFVFVGLVVLGSVVWVARLPSMTAYIRADSDPAMAAGERLPHPVCLQNGHCAPH